MKDHSQRLFWVSVLMAALGLGLSATYAGAQAPVSPRNAYSFTREGCARAEIADPVTVIFYGTAATTRHLAGYDRGGPFAADRKGTITQHTGWTRHNTDNLFRQYAHTSLGCRRNPGDTDLASAAGAGNDRWHLRMWEANNRAPGENFFVQTTPHREQWVYGDGDDGSNNRCGAAFPLGSHAVDPGAVDRGPVNYARHGSGFDRARRYLFRAYNHTARHRIRQGYFGNTRSVRQCDGGYAGSNGQGLFILTGRDATVTGE